MNPNNNNEMVSTLPSEQVVKQPHPVNQITPLSKYLAMALFVLMPFIGGYVGYQLAPDTVTVQPIYSIDVEDKTLGEVMETKDTIIDSEANNSIVLYAVKESEVSGNGRGYPVMGLYKAAPDKEPVKFATVGGLNEYPIQYAISPDRKKVAVNLETKLVLIDVETGTLETLFTPKFVVGGRITFSPDGTKLAFVDGNYYVQTDNVTLYTIDLLTKKLNTLITQTNINFVDVDAWRPDDIIVLSQTAGKGCALPQYTLYDLKTKQILVVDVPDFSQWSSSGLYIVSRAKTDTPAACANIGNMCDDAYVTATQYKVYDPVSKIIIGEFGQINARIDFVALSPDFTDVIYKSTPWPQTELQCDDRKSNAMYYVKNFKTGNIQPVTNLEITLGEWGISTRDYQSKINFLTDSYATSL